MHKDRTKKAKKQWVITEGECCVCISEVPWDPEEAGVENL